MLTMLEISNYRSLGADVRLNLGELTVLVGPNGAGKSNITDAFQFLADCMHLGLEGAITKRGGMASVGRFSAGRPFNVRVSAHVRGDGFIGRYTFSVENESKGEYRVVAEEAEVVETASGRRYGFLIQDGSWQAGPSELRPKVGGRSLALPLVAADERFAGLADELRSMAVYDIFPGDLREPQKYDPTKPMHKRGTNWTSILCDQPDDSWKPDMVTVLHKLTGDIEDMKIESLGGFLVARFRHTSDSKREKWFDSSQESNGTLRVAGILTALLQQPTPSPVAIEEPELTVHPGALEVVLDYVRQAASGGQVVLTTHSPELLDKLDVATVRVVEKRAGETQIQPLAEGQREAVRRGLLSLGEVLRTEGLQQEIPLAGE